MGQHDMPRKRCLHGEDDAHGRGGSARRGGRRRKGDRLTRVLMIIGIALLVVALCGFGFLGWRYLHARSAFDRIATENAALEGGGLEDYTLDVDWNGLRATNPGIVAWICVPGTIVNYPVVQTTDNDYYLSHAFDGSSSVNGCVFLDYDSAPDLSDRNSIFYGHNMLDGSMFASFLRFEDTDYLAEHPYILLATPDGVTHRLKVCCVVVANGQELLRQTQFSDDAQFQAYVQAALDRNVIPTDVTAAQFDHLFTFATCSYQFNDARTLVYAIEVDKYGNILSEADSATDNVERTTTS